jgi:murein DD-endopeptidase MepM/ murein hydrolase activator NlpD
MSPTDARIVATWRTRLQARTRLEDAAKKRHAAAQLALTQARANDKHPRQALVTRRDAASDTLSLRRRQIAEARRVIARHASGAHVHTPIAPILNHGNGFNPPVHDGVDLISEASDEGWAICDGIIVDARSEGWWGKGAQASHGHPISDGDGIVQLQCTVDVGPFRRGMVFGYGHAEHARCEVGDQVKAGEVICHAGFANAWHFHFMVNGGDKRRGDGGFSGVGTMDPWPFIAYAIGHG